MKAGIPSRFLLIAFIVTMCVSFPGCGEREAASTDDTQTRAESPDARQTAIAPSPPVDLSMAWEDDRLILEWTENNPGDYNLDGRVGSLDVFPLAVHFNQTSNFNGQTATSEGNNCLDGNRDGFLNGLDLFVIATNFGKSVTGYNVYAAPAPEGPFTTRKNETPIPYEGCGAGKEWTDEDPALPSWYSVTSLDGATEEESEGIVGAPPDPPSWHLETVDADGDVGVFTSLAFDEQDGVHISYIDNTGNTLKYARRTGGGWDVQTVDYFGEVRWYWDCTTSIALDVYGRPAISYYAEMPAHELRVAWMNEDGSWDIRPLDQGGIVGEHSSIAFGPDGNPAISYHLRYAYFDLKLARYDGMDWTTEVVDGEGQSSWMGQYTSLAFDSSGNPAISYGDGTGFSYLEPKNLKYAFWNGSNWAVEVVDGEGGEDARAGYWNSLAFRGDGLPAIAYLDGRLNSLKYALRSGSGWETVTVIDSLSGLESCSLAFNPVGTPWISFCDSEGEGGLKVARSYGLNWFVDSIDPADGVGQYSELRFDNAGRPGISYYDSVNGDLKYAWFD